MAEVNTSKSKNQTAAERAAKREQLGMRPTRRYCQSTTCPTPNSPILMKDFMPVKVLNTRGGGGRMRYFHRTCQVG